MRWALLLVSMVMFGCDDAKGPEDDAPVDGKLDSFRSPTDHGVIAFGQSQTGKLTADELHHTWSFTLSAPAALHAFTSRVPHKASIDTVLYLYRRTATGWGAYIARNDDDGRADWSSLDRDLTAGEYRLLVKGHAASTRGSFNLTLDCDGIGCAPTPSCTFGSTYGDIADNARLLVNRQRLMSPTGLSDLDKQRVIIALHQSSHTDVTTVEEAFAAADQGEVNLVRIYETAAARTFTAIEYGAGDNSYGAIFTGDTTNLAANIHDGDLENCNVVPQTCLLGQSWGDLKDSTAFVKTSERVVTQASQLTGVAATQALAAIKIAYEDSSDLANGLSNIDQSQLNVITLRHTATGTVVDAFEYGAGDNSYGAVFRGGTVQVAAEIKDLDFYGCSIFE
jgi:hypothetical protein